VVKNNNKNEEIVICYIIILGLAALEEGEEGKDESRLKLFRDDFLELQSEQFVTCM
jgi:hypothetical protein